MQFYALQYFVISLHVLYYAHVRLQSLMLTVHRNTFLKVQHMLAVDYRCVLQWKEPSLKVTWMQISSILSLNNMQCHACIVSLVYM